MGEKSKETKEFKPTTMMKKVFEIAHTPGVKPLKSEWFRQAGGSDTNWSAWVKKPGFEEWWAEEHDKYMRSSFMRTTLDAIGLSMTKKDYRYWEALKSQYDNLEKKITVKNEFNLSDLDRLRQEKMTKMSIDELQQALEDDDPEVEDNKK